MSCGRSYQKEVSEMAKVQLRLRKGFIISVRTKASAQTAVSYLYSVSKCIQGIINHFIRDPKVGREPYHLRTEGNGLDTVSREGFEKVSCHDVASEVENADIGFGLFHGGYEG